MKAEGRGKSMSTFYESYAATKAYTTPDLNAKHIKRFTDEVWSPAGVHPTMRCLEIGCGTGHFLSFLDHMGVGDFQGIDLDPAVAEVIPMHVKNRFQVADVHDFLKSDNAKQFDRIFMFDVFEHFTKEDGLNLLLTLKKRLGDDGKIVLKMPNAGSPFGLQFQFGDLTHLTGYTTDSIRQMAIAAGMRLERCYPHLLGSPGRRRTDAMMQAILNKLIASPPEIWEGNFYAILTHDHSGAKGTS
jgi:2-polyprenyl-3-methyl-5-hydroxy-6-metoxy-1,4-benzoquinol methylase